VAAAAKVHPALRDHVCRSDRIKTPLLLMSGELNSNVPARQATEMYYALRLGKEVERVQYMDGGHGMPTVAIDESQAHCGLVRFGQALAVLKGGNDLAIAAHGGDMSTKTREAVRKCLRSLRQRKEQKM